MRSKAVGSALALRACAKLHIEPSAKRVCGYLGINHFLHAVSVLESGLLMGSGFFEVLSYNDGKKKHPMSLINAHHWCLHTLLL